MTCKLVNSKLLVVVLMLTGLIIVGCSNTSMDSMKQHDSGSYGKMVL